MKVTVLIPTHRRPALLRSTLQSVQGQSRPDLIAEVIVSENSDDPGSESVCREFPSLPLRHVFQLPVVSAGEHFARLLDRAKTEWVALLGDDDMWGRYHLEEAVRCLAKYPSAVAYVAQDARVTSDARTATGGHHCSLITANSPERRDTFADSWLIDQLEMGVACLAVTPLNVWAVVGRRDALAEAFQAFSEPDSGHDSDRFMFWLLARQGPVVVGREIGAFYRIHAGNACKQLLSEDFAKQQRKAAKYTHRIIADAEKDDLPLKEAWMAAITNLAPRDRLAYWESAIPGAKQAIESKWRADVRPLFQNAPQALAWLAAQYTPPILWRHILRLKSVVRTTNSAKQ